MYLLTFRRYFLHIHGQPVQELGLAQLDHGDEGTATSETSFIIHQSTRRNHAGELNLIFFVGGGGSLRFAKKLRGKIQTIRRLARLFTSDYSTAYELS